MPVYVIAEVELTNSDAMAKEFSAKNQPIVRAAGGRYLAAEGLRSGIGSIVLQILPISFGILRRQTNLIRLMEPDLRR